MKKKVSFDIEDKVFIEKFQEKIKKKFGELIDKIPIGLFAYVDFKVVYANKEMLKIMGFFTENEFVGRNILDFVPPENRDKLVSEINIALDRGFTRGVSVIHEILLPDGTRKYLEIKAKLVYIENLPVFLDFALDRTREVEIQKELEEKEERFNKLFNNAYDAIFFEKCSDGRIIDVNKAACELLGYTKDELIGMSAYKLVPEEFIKKQMDDIKDSILRKKKYMVITENIRKDGTRVPVEVSIGSVDVNGEREVIVIARDMREKKKLQDQLVRLQKMETIGSLVSGLVHDFNNLLSAMIGYIDLYRFTPDPKKREEYIDKIVDIIENGKALTKEVLLFARRDPHVKDAVVDIVSIIENVINMASRTFPKTISLKFIHEPDVAYVKGSEAYLAQVFLNLLLNARDAIGENEGSIEIILREKDDEYIIDVKDTGCGMDKDIMKKIFEPFFTTKKHKNKKGTGLGLAIVHSVITYMGGEIKVSSEKGKGTVFTISLPKAEVPAKGMPPKEEKIESLKKGNGKILFVDDEDQLRKMWSMILNGMGYSVEVAKDGIEALEILKKENVDLVILDMIMPRLDGKGVLRRLSLFDNPPWVLISTGFTDIQIDALRKEFPFVKEVMFKPYRAKELSYVLEKLLS